MKKIYEKCCWIELHKKFIKACFRTGNKQETRKFNATSRELFQFADWLKEGRCEMAAMGSTAFYWELLYNILESSDLKGIVVRSNDIRYIKMVPGREANVTDAEWLADLLQHGLFRACRYHPCKEQKDLREMIHYRISLAEECTREFNRFQKIMERADIRRIDMGSNINGESIRNFLKSVFSREIFDEKTYDEIYNNEVISFNLKAKEKQIIDNLNRGIPPEKRHQMEETLRYLDEIKIHIINMDRLIDSFMKPKVFLCQDLAQIKMRNSEC